MTVDPTTLAKERQTSLGLYVTAKEAYDLWQADPEGVREDPGESIHTWIKGAEKVQSRYEQHGSKRFVRASRSINKR